MSPTDALIAYCAGIIDADGTIGIVRQYRKGRPPNELFERICVAQVTPEALDLCRALFAGSRSIHTARAPNRMPMQSWIVTHMLASSCLRTIMPYLRIKRVQAENCLAFRELRQQSKMVTPRPRELTEAMEFCYATAKMLNSGGVQDRSTPKETAS